MRVLISPKNAVNANTMTETGCIEDFPAVLGESNVYPSHPAPYYPSIFHVK